MGKFKWYFKQIVPLTYISTFREDDQRKLCIWKMWLGRSFNIRYFNLAA